MPKLPRMVGVHHYTLSREYTVDLVDDAGGKEKVIEIRKTCKVCGDYTLLWINKGDLDQLRALYTEEEQMPDEKELQEMRLIRAQFNMWFHQEDYSSAIGALEKLGVPAPAVFEVLNREIGKAAENPAYLSSLKVAFGLA